MRLNFPLVVFDLETTDDDSHRVIEIGAVALDRNLFVAGVGHGFESKVWPGDGIAVSERVTELTGHSLVTLAGSPTFNEAAAAFEAWCTEATGVNRIQKLRLAAWGNYFDINVLRAEYARHGREFPFSGTVVDVKTVALMWLALSGRRTDSCSVGSTMDEMGLVPIGEYHRARVDAAATADILYEAVSQIEGGVWVGKQYVAVRPEAA